MTPPLRRPALPDVPTHAPWTPWQPTRSGRAGFALAGFALTLAAAWSGPAASKPAAPPAAEPTPEAAYVVLGPGGQGLLRALTTAPTCPTATLDGQPHAMTLRAAPAEVADRGGAQADHKAAAFPLSTCELALPARTRRLRLAGRALPVPVAQPRRIVVIGDTGCRMKASEGAYQACHDAQAWPLPTLSRRAAAWRPDLVIHLGDLHYRESPCLPGWSGCQDSPWGYGHDVWAADLFQPAAALLAAAPWVIARGNHESCARAGQGWHRYLDPRPYDPALSCDDPAHDDRADFSPPYAVPLSDDLQLVVFDSSRAAGKPAAPGSALYRRYEADLRQVDALVQDRPHSLFVSHHPILGFGAGAHAAVRPGNATMQSVMQDLHPQTLFPAPVVLGLHGHIHLFEALTFRSAHPATIVAGISGSALSEPLPPVLPAGAQPAPGAEVASFITHADFGYLTLERTGRRWHLQARDVHGRAMTRCTLDGRHLACRDRAAARR